MKKPLVAFLNTVAAAGANVLDDTVAKHYVICSDNTADPVSQILPPIPYGKIISVDYITSNAEVTKIALVNTSATLFETIVASNRYKIQVAEHFADVGTIKPRIGIYAYTAPAVLSGNAITDRLNVYTALINKINNHAAATYSASRTILVPFTGGSSVGDAFTNFTVGEVVTQTTSTVTGKVAKCTISTGTMFGDDAAGYLWVYDISDYDTLDVTTNRVWTGTTTSIVVTGTAASIKTVAGITIIDDTGYYTSNLSRGGVTNVGLDGFDSDVVTITREGEYADGIGSVLTAQYPVYTRDRRDVVSGQDKLHSIFDVPVTTKNYTKCIVSYKGGVPETQAGMAGDIAQEYVLYADESNGTTLAALKVALSAMS